MRYWLYKNSEISGPFAPEDFDPWRGVGLDALVCPEGADGSREDDWVGISEVPELAGVLERASEFSGTATATAEQPIRLSVLEEIGIEPALNLPPAQEEAPPETQASLSEWAARRDEAMQAERRRVAELEGRLQKLAQQLAQYEIQQNQMLDRLSHKEELLGKMERLLEDKDREIEALRLQAQTPLPAEAPSNLPPAAVPGPTVASVEAPAAAAEPPVAAEQPADIQPSFTLDPPAVVAPAAAAELPAAAEQPAAVQPSFGVEPPVAKEPPTVSAPSAAVDEPITAEPLTAEQPPASVEPALERFIEPKPAAAGETLDAERPIQAPALNIPAAVRMKPSSQVPQWRAFEPPLPPALGSIVEASGAAAAVADSSAPSVLTPGAELITKQIAEPAAESPAAAAAEVRPQTESVPQTVQGPVAGSLVPPASSPVPAADEAAAPISGSAGTLPEASSEAEEVPSTFVDLSDAGAKPPMESEPVETASLGEMSGPPPGAPTPAPHLSDLPTGYTPPPSAQDATPASGVFLFPTPTPLPLKGPGAAGTWTPGPTTVPGASTAPPNPFQDMKMGVPEPITLIATDISQAEKLAPTLGKESVLAGPGTAGVKTSPARRRQSKMFLVVLGAGLAALALIGVYVFRHDPGEIAEMFSTRPKAHPAPEPEEMIAKGPPTPLRAVKPMPAAPAAPAGESAMPSSGRAAPREASGRDYIPNTGAKAVEFVKNYPLGRERGTIEKWFQYSFLNVPGSEEEWTQGASDASTYFVQYRVFQGGKSAPGAEPISYIFEVDLLKNSIRGINPAAKDLLAGVASQKPRAAKRPRLAKRAKPAAQSRRAKPTRRSKRAKTVKREKSSDLVPLLPLPDEASMPPASPDSVPNELTSPE